MRRCAIERGSSRKTRALSSTIVLPVENVVPGDVPLLSAGNIAPADCRLLETRDLVLNEATGGPGMLAKST